MKEMTRKHGGLHTFQDCLFTNSTAAAGGGPAVYYNYNTTFTRCNFTHNEGGEIGGGGALTVVR